MNNIERLIKEWEEEKIPEKLQMLMLAVIYISCAKFVIDILKKIKDGEI